MDHVFLFLSSIFVAQVKAILAGPENRMWGTIYQAYLIPLFHFFVEQDLIPLTEGQKVVIERYQSVFYGYPSADGLYFQKTSVEGISNFSWQKKYSIYHG